MSDKTRGKDLEAVLLRLKNEWEELAALLGSRGIPQERVIEVEEILLRDGAGHYRGKISAPADGSAGLLLSDREGNAWARLGINQNGEAFLELKDQKGEISFKVPEAPPSPEVEAGLAAPAPEELTPTPAAPPEEPSAAAQPPTTPAAEAGAPPGGAGPIPEALPPGPAAPPSGDTQRMIIGMIIDRLEKLERYNRRKIISRALILVLLGVVLATQAFLLVRPYLPGPLEVEGLVVRGPSGGTRALLGGQDDKFGLDLRDRKGTRRATLGLGSGGVPGLTLYDQNQRVRVELNLGPDGAPKLELRDKRSLLSKTLPNAPKDTGRQQLPGDTVPGTEEGTVTSTPTGQEAAVSPKKEGEAEFEFVGSKTSNKYHYPTCKWVKWIHPTRLIKFKSVEEAKERGYIPCPQCKPPRQSW